AEQANRIAAVYDQMAALIGADRQEIGLIENATRAWDMAFYAIPFQVGDCILTSMAEYSSNVIAFLQVARRGVTVDVIPNDAAGQVDVAALSQMMDEHVRVVAISHMPTNGGLVQPAAAIGEVTRKWPALYILDACQSVGQMPIDVREIGCDVLSATSRKYLRGPRGAGFLYVRADLIPQLEPPFLDNHAANWVARDRYEVVPDATRFENWERSYANLLGMGEAAALAMELGLDSIWEHVSAAGKKLRERLVAIDRVRITDIGSVQSGIVTFVIDGVDPEVIKANLAALRINVTTSSVMSTRFDMEDRELTKVVRSSVHYLTTDDEIQQLAGAVENIAHGK
ncbi:MAG TPA: aminotransferase class V-fold PLP-dependent enzyme, partial [Thermomicrobiales bacterium]|nr:aminotransferase class V-fold PLP-dependent enzyme [Thermomicrobiales bacterium]